MTGNKNSTVTAISKIYFNIDKPGLTTLKVYDISGKEIASLMNEKLIAGTYIVKFNGNSFASGVYYYSLTTKDFKQTKKMLLIK